MGFAGCIGFILALHAVTDPRFLSNSVVHLGICRLIHHCKQAPSKLLNPDPQKTDSEPKHKPSSGTVSKVGGSACGEISQQS